MTEYAPGVPAWVDVSSPDLDRARDFYRGLFGWHPEVMPEAGGYTFFLRDGKPVAAAGPGMTSEQPPIWTTYVITADADESARRAREAGGQVVVEPMDVMGEGRLAIIQDPAGAFIGLWQPERFAGAGVVNEVNSLCWNELYTRDMPAASAFYRTVFGWDPDATEYDGGAYTMFNLAGRPVAGGMDVSSMPEPIPPHWHVYFAVDNAGDAVDRAGTLGGTVVRGPEDTPMGPIAVLQDPAGATFSVIQMNRQS